MAEAVSALNVRVGTPDQDTTGAILCAPIGSKLPTNQDMKVASVTIDEAFEASGYISSDGLTLTPDMSTSDINDWSGALVRRILESFNGTLSWSMIEINERSAKMAFGDDNVSTVEATAEHGTQQVIKIGARLSASKSWVFKMKDGRARIMIVVPNGQITTIDEISFNATDPISFPVELSTYPDASGNSIYIYTDDGVVSA